MNIPEHCHNFESSGWVVSHRMNSTLPGYLMISSKVDAQDLSELSETALSELGPLLAVAQRVLKHELLAQWVYIGRYGHTPACPIHFHVIPIYDWVADLFWKDHRYRLLETFTDGASNSLTDGAELTLFVWREFCERPDPPPVSGPSVREVIALLREKLRPYLAAKKKRPTLL